MWCVPSLTLPHFHFSCNGLKTDPILKKDRDEEVAYCSDIDQQYTGKVFASADTMLKTVCIYQVIIFSKRVRLGSQIL